MSETNTSFHSYRSKVSENTTINLILGAMNNNNNNNGRNGSCFYVAGYLIYSISLENCFVKRQISQKSTMHHYNFF